MTKTNKEYLTLFAGTIFTIYLLSISLLSLLTIINSIFGYSLSNFLGFGNNLEVAVSHLFFAQNDLYLQQWNSFPPGTFIISTLFFIAFLFLIFKIKKEMKKLYFYLIFFLSFLIGAFNFYPVYYHLLFS